MAKGIIFDLGHTLIEFQADWDQIYEEGKLRLREFLTGSGLSAPDELLEDFERRREHGHSESDRTNIEFTAGKALRESFRRFGVNGKTKGKKFIEKALEAYFEPEIREWTRYPDSLPLLETLRNLGYRVGLISNCADSLFPSRCVQKSGFSPFLEPIISSAAFAVRKPHPEIFLHVAQQWGIKPEEIVMVGDQLYYDIYGAHQVGMKGIWLDRKTDKAYTYIPDSLKLDPMLIPDATVSSLSEIPPVLDSFSR